MATNVKNLYTSTLVNQKLSILANQ